MTSYLYHDMGDEITSTFIHQYEPYEGYWAESEQKALDRVEAYLSSHSMIGGDMRALDLGCGEGRLIPWLAKFSHSILAIDPDPQRIKIASETYRNLSQSLITLRVGNAEDIEKGQYKLVMFSHILQHIHTDTIVPILQTIYDLMEPSGVLILMYCKSTKVDKGLDRFSFDTLRDGEVISTPVSEEDFNSFVQEGVTNGLPVHHINPLELRQSAEMIGWQPKFSWAFHSVQDDPGYRGQDNKINASENHKHIYGRDIVEIWQHS